MQAITSNLVSMFSERQLNINTKNKAKSAEKLSGGYRINRAADDAAGLVISEKMRSRMRGLNRGSSNISEGVSWVQTADGAMNEIDSMIQRIRELAVQGSNGTNTYDDLEAINEEITQIKKAINNIGIQTEFNGEEVFDNSFMQMEVEGRPRDLDIFDSSYDATTGDVTYGGFVFHGERITWDKVDSNMVKVTNGEQMFVGGTTPM